jgi:hypothetical protein
MTERFWARRGLDKYAGPRPSCAVDARDARNADEAINGQINARRAAVLAPVLPLGDGHQCGTDQDDLRGAPTCPARAAPALCSAPVLFHHAAASFAAQHGISDPSPRLLAGHPAVCDTVAAAVKTANSTLSRAEQIKRFTILPVFWRPGGDEIAPTMKLKRQGGRGEIRRRYRVHVRHIRHAPISGVYGGSARRLETAGWKTEGWE